MNVFEELHWQQFVKLPSVVKLPLHEQIQQYNQYLANLSIARLTWLEMQTKGPLSSTSPAPIEELGFLLQEDLFDLEQEDGNKIIITGYA
jgi:hypothetical protein